MEKADIQKALDELKQQPKRKFVQTYDLIFNLRNLLIAQNPIDLFVTLPKSRGKAVKVAAFVDQQLAEQAQKHCDLAIKESEFSKYADKKKQKQLAETYDYFLAQSTLMPKVAASFGKVLGTRGKMPNPKLGGVVPPTANLAPLRERLNKTVRLSAKKSMNMQCSVGKENQPDEEIIENILAVHHALARQLPNETQNIRNVALKLTMGKPVRIGA
ncbi:MAG: 50S ribosomal protein L1 [Nanoarchaeota archaeon]|nr:50S ribosomal protein L1 [Nanoarchaeota archaeon]